MRVLGLCKMRVDSLELSTDVPCMSAHEVPRRCTCQLCVPEWDGMVRRVDVPMVPDAMPAPWTEESVVIADNLPTVPDFETVRPVAKSTRR